MGSEMCIRDRILPVDRRSLFNKLFAKLDISQVIGHLQEEDRLKKLKSVDGESLFSAISSSETPWANMLAYAVELVKLDMVESWTEEDLKVLGKFAVTLSSDQIGRIPTEAFTQSAVDAILSDRLTLGQLTAIFMKIVYKEIQPKNDLFSAFLQLLQAFFLLILHSHGQ